MGKRNKRGIERIGREEGRRDEWDRRVIGTGKEETKGEGNKKEEER